LRVVVITVMKVWDSVGSVSSSRRPVVRGVTYVFSFLGAFNFCAVHWDTIFNVNQRNSLFKL